MKKLLLTALVLITTYSAHMHAQSVPLPLGQMPTIQTATLGERKLTLPSGLPGEKTLALIAFEREQQTQVNTWIKGLSLATSTQPWVELPVVGERGRIMRAFIDSGMRRGIVDEAMRNRVITLYIDRDEFVKAMGFTGGTNTIYATIINRTGQVLAVVEGDYTAEKAALLAKTFE